MSSIEWSASTTVGSEAQRSSSRTSAGLGLRSERRRGGGRRHGGFGTHSRRGHTRGDLWDLELAGGEGGDLGEGRSGDLIAELAPFGLSIMTYTENWGPWSLLMMPANPEV